MKKYFKVNLSNIKYVWGVILVLFMLQYNLSISIGSINKKYYQEVLRINCDLVQRMNKIEAENQDIKDKHRYMWSKGLGGGFSLQTAFAFTL